MKAASVRLSTVSTNLDFSESSNANNKNTSKIYKSMISKGDIWKGMDRSIGKKEISRLSQTNLDSVYPLFGAERTFFDNFCKQTFYVSHFSNSDFRNEDGSVDILSRNNLVKKKISFPKNNTERLDMESFATTGFCFMALECGNSSKTTSRFGNFSYKMKLDDVDKKTLSDAFCQANDFGNFDERPSEKTPKFLDPIDRNNFFHGPDVKNREILSLVFKGDKAVEGLALSIIKDARNLSDNTRKNIFSAKSSSEFNSIVNSFYRPQLLFPEKMHIPSDKLIYTKGNNVPHFYV